MSTLFSYFFDNFKQISPLESKFTEVLDSIVLKPKTLYFYGKMPENVSKNVAIVGSRHNTRYGEEIAYKMAYELAKKGVVIISGLAYGIDSIAHRAALDAGGTTIAILGTPINQIYPRSHTKLAIEIIEKGGAIISEYPKDAKVYPKTSFLERNRLISGLSDAVVIVEAAERSGTLNTAAHAINQGKEVFAVPGNITNPYSKGCNALISQGAIPYTDFDVLNDFLFPEEKRNKKRKISPKGDSNEETKILEIIQGGIRDGELILEKSGFSVEKYNEIITLLEIKGLVRSLGANNWSLN